MTLATPGDVGIALMRELGSDEVGFVQPMLDYIESLVMLRAPQAIEAARTDIAQRKVVVRVEAEAVARVLRAPAGGVMKYETEGTYTYSVNQAVASGLLELTVDDWRALRRGVTGWGSVNQVMDGYARGRVGNLPPDGVRFSIGFMPGTAAP